MRNIIVITHVSLDGVMQSPGARDEDPSNGFTHGGWIMAYGDEALHDVLCKTIAGEFDLLLGRRTYEIFAGYWPHHGDNPIGVAFNRATKHVATRTLERLEWEHSRRLGDDVVAEVRKLKAMAGPEIHVWGSSELLQTLIAADLIDEFRLWVYPVVLGAGKRLFGTQLPPRGLTLVESRRTPRGVILNTYRAGGALKDQRRTLKAEAAARQAGRSNG